MYFGKCPMVTTSVNQGSYCTLLLADNLVTVSVLLLIMIQAFSNILNVRGVVPHPKQKSGCATVHHIITGCINTVCCCCCCCLWKCLYDVEVKFQCMGTWYDDDGNIYSAMADIGRDQYRERFRCMVSYRYYRSDTVTHAWEFYIRNLWKFLELFLFLSCRILCMVYDLWFFVEWKVVAFLNLELEFEWKSLYDS